MTVQSIADTLIETDVLVIGAGIAGCPVAAKAREQGLDVTIVEKSKPERSGSAAIGIDHYGTFPRDGATVLELVRAWEGWQGMMNGGRFTDPNIKYRLFDNSFWTLEELEKLGVTMKWDDGDYRWIPSHIGAGGKRIMMRVHWQSAKPQMAQGMRKRGVKILERCMVVDLLTHDNRVVGATAVNTRTGKFIVIKSKAAVISTGEFTRCYNPETPLIWKYQYKYHWCPASVSGDGWATTYRAGAELANMYNTGFGFRIRDDATCAFGNFPNNEGLPMKAFSWTGEEIPPANAIRYTELEQKGLTPIYYTVEHLPEDYQKRIEVATVDERLLDFKISEERGFNHRRHRYEVMANKPHNFSAGTGINVDETFRTSLMGLFAVGNSVAGCQGCGDATTSGFLVGDSLSSMINEIEDPVVDVEQVKNQKNIAFGPMAVKDGTEPVELECAIRHICERYIGQVKNEGKLREGLRRLGSLRREFLPQLMAKNPHYLMRCLEVRNIMDLAEVHMRACLERKESRAGFIRSDYPEMDPSLDDLLFIQRRKDGELFFETRPVPELKPEYAKEGK